MASIKLKGDTSGEVTISAPSVAGTTTLTLPATSSTLATQNSLGVRNLIINGDMRIAQRGTSVTNVTGGNYNTVDRWQWVEVSTATLDMEQSTDVPTGQGFVNSVKLTVNTADASIASSDYSYYRQSIEGYNAAHLEFGTANAKTITVSFWVKSNLTGTYCITLHNNTFTRSYIAEYTIDSANTWEKKTITIAGDTTGTWTTDNTRGLLLHFTLATGTDFQGSLGWQANAKLGSSSQTNWLGTTSNYINITGVQLEVGTETTPFEHRPYDTELARCKRYYEKSYPIGTLAGSAVIAGRRQMGGSNVSGTTSFLSGPLITFEVEKRTTPTIVLYDGSGNSGKCTRYQLALGDSNNENVNTADIGSTGLYTYSASGASRSGVGVHFTANAEL